MLSLFTKIIEGSIPSYKVFEDEHTYAFLTLEAIQLGHTLIVPKVDVDLFTDVPEPYYSAVFINAKPLAQAIQRATACKRVGTIIAGWDVPHFHYHLVPMWDPSDLSFGKARQHSREDNLRMQGAIVERLG